MTTELKPIPLVVQPSNRDRTTTKDAKLINCVIERQPDGTVHVMKRPGITYLSDLVLNTTMLGIGAGLGETWGVYYDPVAVTTKLYRLFPGSGVIFAGTLDGSAGIFPWHFSTNRAVPKQMLITGGFVAYWSSIGVLNPLTSWVPTSGGYPVLSPIVNLNGLTYVMTTDGKIWNSNINDVSTWNALNFFQTQNDSDDAITMEKQLTYIVVFKNYSIEVLYDAGRTQGTPLARNDSAKITDQGIYDRRTLVRLNGMLVWVGQARGGGVFVSMMSGLNVSVISTPNIDRLLASDWSVSGNIYAFGVRLDGHDLYVLSIGSPMITLAYDLTEGAWYQWTNSDGSPFTYFSVTADKASSVVAGGPVLYGATDGKSYSIGFNINHDTTSGGTQLIPVDIYTPLYDQGVRLKKYCSKLEIHGDQQDVGTVNVYTTDDDYKTWSAARPANISDGVATLTNCGTFRRRGWHLSHVADAPFRVTNLVAHIMLGTS